MSHNEMQVCTGYHLNRFFYTVSAWQPQRDGLASLAPPSPAPVVTVSHVALLDISFNYLFYFRTQMTWYNESHYTEKGIRPTADYVTRHLIGQFW